MPSEFVRLRPLLGAQLSTFDGVVVSRALAKLRSGGVLSAIYSSRLSFILYVQYRFQ